MKSDKEEKEMKRKLAEMPTDLLAPFASSQEAKKRKKHKSEAQDKEKKDKKV